MKQEWVCEDCGLNGVVEYRPHEGVFAVVHAIRDQHETLAAKYAPLCHFDIDRTRVRNSKTMDEFGWNRLVAQIERKTENKRKPR
jgi:hypothetical protein